jgi:hypothetical protein
MIVVLAAVASIPVIGEEEKDGIDAEGYVRTWLVLAPIPLKGGQEGADALGEEQVKGEANLKPKAGDTIDVGGKDLAWKECVAKDQVVDFNGVLGKETERSVGYAVAYIVADADFTDVTLKLGSDDQIKVYLNGKPIHANDEGRPFEKDEDSVPGLSLRKGRNVLVVKVVNEEEDWAMSACFIDKDGKPVTGLKATTKPERSATN